MGMVRAILLWGGEGWNRRSKYFPPVGSEVIDFYPFAADNTGGVSVAVGIDKDRGRNFTAVQQDGDAWVKSMITMPSHDRQFKVLGDGFRWCQCSGGRCRW